MKTLMAVVLASLLASVSFAQLREVPDNQCRPPQAAQVQRWVNGPQQHHNMAPRCNRSNDNLAAALLFGIIAAAACDNQPTYGFVPQAGYIQTAPFGYQPQGYGYSSNNAAALAEIERQQRILSAQAGVIQANQRLLRAQFGY